MHDSQVLKRRAISAIEARRAEFIELSSAIHTHPELAFQERQSAALLCDELAAHGFTIQRGVGGLETAFRAEACGASDGPTVAFLAEYDALPEIGHACGHNIIGTAAVAAGIGVQAVLDQLPGRVVVIGTPAEEGGGGKVILLERGVFKGVDAAMMVHPSSYTMVNRGSLASMGLTVSHAAAAPEDGISALEAVILTFNNVNAVRLHLKGDARVHGIITRGGTAVNIIPDYAEAVFSVRAATQGYAVEVLRRVVQCAEAAALATGTQLKHTVRPGYAAMLPNGVMAQLFADNWRSIGVEVRDPRSNERMGSTDFGNISQALPGIHPYITIAPEDVAGHTIQAAQGMAMTAIDLLGDPARLAAARHEFAVAHGAQ